MCEYNSFHLGRSLPSHILWIRGNLWLPITKQGLFCLQLRRRIPISPFLSSKAPIDSDQADARLKGVSKERHNLASDRLPNACKCKGALARSGQAFHQVPICGAADSERENPSVVVVRSHG